MHLRVGNDLLATFGASPSPIQRPENAILPPKGVEGLVGLYEDPAYGRMELCLASVNTSTVYTSDNCQELTSKVEVILPGVVDPTVPTLLAKWDRPFGAYLCLSHLNESSFSLSVFNSYVSIAISSRDIIGNFFLRSPQGTLRVHFGHPLWSFRRDQWLSLPETMALWGLD